MKKQVVAPRLPTPGPPVGGSSSARMPDDVVADQISRLKLFALVSGGMWLIGLIMDSLAFPAVMPYQVTRSTIVIEVVAVLFAAAVYLHVHLSGWAPRAKADAGLVLMLLNSAGIAALETWSRPLTPDSFGHLSWIPIVILVSAVIMPGRPRPMLFAALASASMARWVIGSRICAGSRCRA